MIRFEVEFVDVVLLTSAHRFVAMADIKVNLVGDFGTFGCLNLLCAEESTDGDEDENKNGSTEHGVVSK